MVQPVKKRLNKKRASEETTDSVNLVHLEYSCDKIQKSCMSKLLNILIFETVLQFSAFQYIILLNYWNKWYYLMCFVV